MQVDQSGTVRMLWPGQWPCSRLHGTGYSRFDSMSRPHSSSRRVPTSCSASKDAPPWNPTRICRHLTTNWDQSAGLFTIATVAGGSLTVASSGSTDEMKAKTLVSQYQFNRTCLSLEQKLHASIEFCLLVFLKVFFGGETGASSNEQMSSAQNSPAMTAHLCSRPSPSPQEQRGNWLASPVQVGLVVRYLGLSASPPELAERLLAELQKTLRTQAPLPGPLGSRFAVSAGRQTKNLFFVVSGFLFLSRASAVPGDCTTTPAARARLDSA